MSGLLSWRGRTEGVAHLYSDDLVGRVHDWIAWLLVGLPKVMLADGRGRWRSG